MKQQIVKTALVENLLLKWEQESWKCKMSNEQKMLNMKMHLVKVALPVKQYCLQWKRCCYKCVWGSIKESID